MATGDFLALPLDQAVPLAQIPRLTTARLRAQILAAVTGGCRIATLFGWPDAGQVSVVAVLADPATGMTRVAVAEAVESWVALTPDCPQAELFERELAEQTGLEITGHPWLKPVRRPPVKGVGSDVTPYEFFAMTGDEVHEVAVGPVHAGVIEPGHFRFQCHGETVFHLEIVHGYQHRGVEEFLVGGPSRRSVHVIETAAGDTTVGHTTAYCRLLEILGGCHAPARGAALRAIALELERIANHTGDLGAMSGDVGYLPAASFLGRLRGEILNLTAEMCGSRFGRGLIRPGGVAFNVDAAVAADLADRLTKLAAEIGEVTKLMWGSPSLCARFDDAGIVSAAVARDLGLVGPVARAAGLAVDARSDFPTGFYNVAQVATAGSEGGDCQARALVRQLEIERSVAFVCDLLHGLPRAEARLDVVPAPRAEMLAVTCVEGWRGEIWHAAVTDKSGRLQRYKIVDPSFHNWSGLAWALRNEAIADFPLCNKSFNLSYCGFDL